MEVPGSVREIVEAYPELRGLVRTGHEQTSLDQREARRRSIPPDPERLLDPGDNLAIEVYGENADPGFSRRCTVNADGTFNYPLLGQLLARGRRRGDIQAELCERLGAFVREPVVTVERLPRFVFGGGGMCPAPKVVVLGGVGRPGIVLHSERLHALDSITVAGWFAPDAARREVWVIRSRTRTTRAVLVVCNLDAVLLKANVAEDVFLAPDDIIYVPRHTAEPEANRVLMNEVVRFLAGASPYTRLLAALRGKP